MLGCLYFIHSDSQSAVKVGFATDVDDGFPSLQSGNPARLRIGATIPIESDAERRFHRIMRPHRIAREWYPADLLMQMLQDELVEAWGDKVEQNTPFGSWPENGDLGTNLAGVYLTGAEMSAALVHLLKSFFEPDEDGDWPGDEVLPTNHWALGP